MTIDALLHRVVHRRPDDHDPLVLTQWQGFPSGAYSIHRRGYLAAMGARVPVPLAQWVPPIRVPRTEAPHGSG